MTHLNVTLSKVAHNTLESRTYSLQRANLVCYRHVRTVLMCTVARS